MKINNYSEFSVMINMWKISNQIKAIIAIDFDGTIIEDHYYPNFGRLIINSKKFINKLYDNGYYIIIWTCRNGKKDINKIDDYLKLKKIKFHKINEDIDIILKNFKSKNLRNKCKKVYADVYIDDKQVCWNFKWDQMYNWIKNKFE